MDSTLHLPSSPATHDLRRRWLGPRSYWLCQLVGWGGLFALWLLPLPFRKSPNVTYEALFALLLSITGLAISHLQRVAFLFHLRQPRSWFGMALRLVPWSLAAALAHVSVLLWIMARFTAPADAPALDEVLASQTLAYLDTLSISASLFLIWTGFYLGLRYYRQYQAALVDRLTLDAAVKDAELRALKAQINPHFLFNSLNSLRALIPRDLAPPREAITLLSDLLRASLTAGHEETIPLARELETVENYLALERLRFEERLAIRRTVEPAALAWPIPPFLLQTLVENAVKYGLGPREQGATITLAAAVRAGALHLRITNPGTLAAASASTGLGLKNARARLALLFGAGASLTLVQAAPDLVAAELVLPPLPQRPAPPAP